MRLFTGISLPPQARAPLLAAINRLRPLGKLSWTPEAKLHITTKFIGEWPESRLTELQQVLATVEIMEPVDIRITGLRWLSGALCAGVDMSSDLHHATEAALARMGIPLEQRPYRPHVTLGRTRQRTGALPPAKLDIAPFRVQCFHLYLSSNGTYTRLSDYPLPI